MLAELDNAIMIEREGGRPAPPHAEGKRIGRPARGVDLVELQRLRAQGLSIRQIARRMSIPSSTIATRLKLISRSASPGMALQQSGDDA
jgi:DNA invertase Pin-like site-specific DNA recombinase